MRAWQPLPRIAARANRTLAQRQLEQMLVGGEARDTEKRLPERLRRAATCRP
jgi:hypothetical protein